MVDPKVRKSYREFLKKLSHIEVVRTKWHVPKFLNEEPIYRYWNSISWAEKKRIVSCTTWNCYPAETWHWSGGSAKLYGPVLRKMIRFYSLSSPRDREVFVKHSQGVLSVMMFDIATHSERLKMANRLSRSKDKRIKGRALSILPVSKIRWALHDSNYSVRNKAVARIGFENCYKEFLPKPSEIGSCLTLSWVMQNALQMADYIDVVEHIENITEETPDYIASILISKIPREDILYYVDKHKNGQQTSRIIQMVMGIRGT
tara:strand:+ start:5824 stop:6603 length:780 start_codon:yes stop_codon:yes gene_type:complete